jgi:hypothetical protein
MTLDLMAANHECLGQLASGGGWQDTTRFIRAQAGLPVLQRLADEGFSNELPELLDELAKLLPRVTDAGIHEVLDGLQRMVKATDSDMVIVDTGVIP